MQKIAFVLTAVMLLCYCAVSPRTLPLVDYNRRFKTNVQIVALACIAPLITFLSVFDARENDVNALVSYYYFSIRYCIDVSEIISVPTFFHHNHFDLFNSILYVFNFVSSSMYKTIDQCILHIIYGRILYLLSPGDHSHNHIEAGSVFNLGTKNILTNTQSSSSYIALDTSRAQVPPKTNNCVCCRHWN